MLRSFQYVEKHHPHESPHFILTESGTSKRCKGWAMTVKVKVKLSLCFNWAPRHEDVLGSGGISPRILDLGTRWRWVVGFTPRAALPTGKEPLVPVSRRLGGLQSRSGRDGEEKVSQPLPGLESPIIQPVVQRCTTEISRLLCCDYLSQIFLHRRLGDRKLERPSPITWRAQSKSCFPGRLCSRIFKFLSFIYS
jgi:hypothetical protein